MPGVLYFAEPKYGIYGDRDEETHRVHEMSRPPKLRHFFDEWEQPLHKHQWRHFEHRVDAGMVIRPE